MACKCKTKPCNCNDVPGVTPAGYHTLNPASGGIAPSAYYPANGLIYPSTTEAPYQRLKEVPIETGTTALEAYQALILLETNPDCIKDEPNCQSPVGVVATDATTTTITMAWTGNSTALGYSVKAAADGVPVYSEEFADTVTAAMVTGLSPDTEYEIIVGTICDSSPSSTCNSVTLLVSTLGLS